jgi:methionyl-tRNA formyltransferase
MKLRLVALGTTEALIGCCEAWRLHHDVIAIISMPEAGRPDNSFDLQPYAASIAATYLEMADINAANSIDQIARLQPDIIYSMWPKLMQDRIIDLPRLGCIGSHCTALPANRGRHPLHWTIALGIEQTAMSFFKMDSGADTGDVLLQVPFGITSQHTISDALATMRAASIDGCRQLAQKLAATARLTGQPQDHSLANYWRQRSLHDTIIDFRMSATAIDRLVRSYCQPFPGAKLLYKDRLIAIDRAIIGTTASAAQLANIEPGRILAKGQASLTVKADDRSIELFPRDAADLAAIPEKGCILPPTAYHLPDSK